MKENRGTIVSIWAALLIVMLSQDKFANLTIKLGFAVAAGIAVFLCFKDDSPKMQHISYFIAAGLLVGCVGYTLFPNGLSEALKWGEGDSGGMTIQAFSPKEIYQKDRESVYSSLEDLRDDVEQASRELEALNNALASEVSLSKEPYPAEVQELGEVLAGKQSLIYSNFPNIKTDEKELGLFYKTQLFEEVRHYSSFISAFEEYGIECAGLGVDEYTLMLWDVETLYILYSMKKELEPDLLENKWYEEKGLEFDSHKVDMNEYSDLLSYGDWKLHDGYENIYAKDLEKILDGYIMDYYKRFHLNFKRKPA